MGAHVKLLATMIFGLGMASTASSVSASQLTYVPTNPTFGGNPLNGSFLLSQAQAQGLGVKSGQNSPDLSGLDSALSGLGSSINTGTPVVVVNPVPSNP
jgi:curli production assembly/transport component CsgF